MTRFILACSLFIVNIANISLAQETQLKPTLTINNSFFSLSSYLSNQYFNYSIGGGISYRDRYRLTFNASYSRVSKLSNAYLDDGIIDFFNGYLSTQYRMLSSNHLFSPTFETNLGFAGESRTKNIPIEDFIIVPSQYYYITGYFKQLPFYLETKMICEVGRNNLKFQFGCGYRLNRLTYLSAMYPGKVFSEWRNTWTTSAGVIYSIEKKILKQQR